MKTHTWLTPICCFAAALALTLCALALTLGARAADVVDSGKCGDNLTWTLDSDGVLTISGAGAMDDWEYLDSLWYGKNIVTVIIGYGVTNIGNYAFDMCADLTSVTIPDSVTVIGDAAFAGCVNLKSVTIPDSVTVIRYAAFAACYSLTSAAIPCGTTSVGNYAFQSCQNLTDITISNSVTVIGEGAFSGCVSLKSAAIPDSVASIGSFAFYNCKSLTNVTIPDNLTNISAYAFSRCDSLTTVKIPDNVTDIRAFAFLDCANLTSVTIPDSVTAIGYGSLKGCASLTDIYYGGSAAHWRETCWWWKDFEELKNATIHCNVKDIGIGITMTDKNGDTVDANGQTGETEEDKKDAFQEGAELTVSFEAVDPDAVTSSGLVTASVFWVFYDENGLLVSLESKEIDLSNPQSLSLIAPRIQIPKGAKKLKFFILGDGFDPRRAVRMIQSSAA